jgi:hypothetical protein
LARTPDRNGITRDLHLQATTIVHLIDIEKIDLRSYVALILDTQGSEC